MYRQIAEVINKYLPNNERNRLKLFDIGFGSGETPVGLSKLIHCKEVNGIDMSPAALANADKFTTAARLHLASHGYKLPIINFALSKMQDMDKEWKKLVQQADVVIAIDAVWDEASKKHLREQVVPLVRVLSCHLYGAVVLIASCWIFR